MRTPPLTRKVLWHTLIGGATGLLLWLVLPRAYTASTTFTPEVNSSTRSLAGLGNLGSLVGQLGLSSLMGAANSTPDYYIAVLQSRELLESAAQSMVGTSRGSEKVRALTMLHLRHTSSVRDSLFEAVKKLRKLTKLSLDGRTGIITVSTTLPDPVAAADLANTLVSLLNDFNLSRRQSQSHAQREFTGKRLQQVAAELRAAEDDETAFLEQNRVYQSSPVLMLEQQRLDRIVQQKQQVYNALSQSYEDARIAELQDTPLLTTIDTAVPPTRPSSFGWYTLLLIGAMLGVMIALARPLIDFVLRSPAMAVPAAATASWAPSLPDSTPSLRAR